MVQERVSVPNIGDASDVDVIEILVKPGMHIDREQPLIVLESEKASMDVPSPLAGIVREISVKVGDKVSEGSPILVVDVQDGAQAAQSALATPSTAAAPEPERAGTSEPTPPPATQATAAPAAEPRPALGTAPVRTVPPAPSVAVSQPQSTGPALPYASPAVRRMARELGVDLRHVPGSAAHGRITKEDVQAHVKQVVSLATAPAGVGFTVAEAPEIDFSEFGPIRVEPLTKIQRVSGRNLHRSWVTIPHVTQFDSADITELEEFRKKMRGDHPEVKLTLVTFFMKALVSALKSMPRFNASLDRSGDNLVFKDYFHIGVAVDTPNGLVVPVIRDVDLKSLGQLASELATVSERARARRLSNTDLQGASITISSLGGIGGTAFTPIINPPEVAVLGVSRARYEPVYQDGTFVPRLLCPLSLSYDHRVIDGADAARFTTRLREILGDIRQMLL